MDFLDYNQPLWRIYLTDAKTITDSTSQYYEVTDENHIMSDLESVKEIFGKDFNGFYLGENIVINEKTQDTVDIKKGRIQYPKFAIYKTQGRLLWENYDDFLLRKKLLADKKIIFYNSGYVLGTLSPYINNKGMNSAQQISGYILWQEVSYLKERKIKNQ